MKINIFNNNTKLIKNFFHLLIIVNLSFSSFVFADNNHPITPDDEPPCCEDDECEKKCPEGDSADPIWLGNGEFYLNKKFIVQPGAQVPMHIRLHYRTGLKVHSVLGYGWTHNYNRRLSETSKGRIAVTDINGIVVYYSPVNNQSGVFKSESDDYEYVRYNGGVYTLTERDKTKYVFNTDGLLTEIVVENGAKLKFTYDPAGKIPVVIIPRQSNLTTPTTAIRDYRVIKIEEYLKNGTKSNRYFNFSYEANTGLLDKIVDQKNRVLDFTHDTSSYGNLETVTDTENNDYTYTYYMDQALHARNYLAVNKNVNLASQYYGFMKTFIGLGCSDCTIRENVYDNDGKILWQYQGSNREGSKFEFVYGLGGYTGVTEYIRFYDELTSQTIDLGSRLDTVNFIANAFDKDRVDTRIVSTGFGTSVADLDYYPAGHQSQGLIKTYKKSDGSITHYEYDDYGFVTKKTQEIDNSDTALITTANYDNYKKMWEQSKRTDRPKEVFRTEYTYHPGTTLVHKEIRKNLNDTDSITEYKYNASGLLEEKIDPNGNRIKYEYTSQGDYPQPAGLLKREYNATLTTEQTKYEYDSVGNQTAIIDANENRTSFVYDKLNRLIEKTEANGLISKWIYDKAILVEIRKGNDANGWRIVKYKYNPFNQRTTTSLVNNTGTEIVQEKLDILTNGKTHNRYNALDQKTAYIYDYSGLSWLKNVEIPSTEAGTNSKTTYQYDNAGNVTQETDPEGNITLYKYDLLNQQIEKTEASGKPEERTTQYDYDAQGNIVQKRILDSSSSEVAKVNYYFDRLGNQLGINWNPSSSTPDTGVALELPQKFTYYPDGSLKSETSIDKASGGTEITTSYEYDDDGNLTKTTNPDGTFTTNAYDLSGNIIQTTDERGIHRYFRYDSSGRRTHTSVETNNDWLASAWYNSANNIISEVKYNLWGQVIETRSPASNPDNPSATASTRTYDGFGRLKSTTNQRGYTTTYSYDDLGNVIKIEYPSINTSPATNISYIYNANNGSLLDSVTDRTGGITSYTYTPNFRRETVISPINQGGASSTYAYDALGRLSSLTNELSEKTTYAYDVLDNTLSITHPDSKVETFTYDVYSQILTHTGAGAYPVKYTYDLQGNLLTLTDSKGGSFGTGATTTWKYDKRSRLIKKIYDDGKAYEYTYDSNGNLKTRKDGKAQTTTYIYETGKNQLKTIDYPTDTDVNFGYDLAGRRITMNDTTGLSEWNYNGDGSLNYYKQNSVDRQISYDYYPDFAKKTLAVARISTSDVERTITYTYDAGRLKTISDPLISSSPIDYTYKIGASLPENIAFPNNTSQKRTFDPLARVKKTEALKNASPLSSFDYTYDQAGQRKTSIYFDGSSTQTRNYGYNEKRELTTASSTATGYDYSYNFDEIGNRKSAVENGTNTTYTPNNLNQYTSINSVSPIYNDNGSLVAYNGKVYTWNEENRLRTVQNGGQSAVFVYSAEGKRVVYLRNGQETRYLYDGWNVLGEYNGSNNLKKAYLWGTDLSSSEQGAGGVGGLLACRDVGVNVVAGDSGKNPDGSAAGGASFYYHYDGNGNVTKLTDASGNVRASYDYSPFGKVIAQSGDYASKNTYTFSTKPHEPISETSYYGFRFYDAKIGRWLSRDPIGEESFYYVFSNIKPYLNLNMLIKNRIYLYYISNSFLFVNNNSINKYDILGLLFDRLPAPGAECRNIDGFYTHCVRSCQLNRCLTPLNPLLAPLVTDAAARTSGDDWGDNDEDDSPSDREGNYCGIRNSYKFQKCKNSCLKSWKKQRNRLCCKDHPFYKLGLPVYSKNKSDPECCDKKKK